MKQKIPSVRRDVRRDEVARVVIDALRGFGRAQNWLVDKGFARTCKEAGLDARTIRFVVERVTENWARKMAA